MFIIRLVLVFGTLSVFIACGGEASPDAPTSTPYEQSDSVLAQKYQEAGERLYAERSSSKAWQDGSNWTDGVSHQLPPLPLNPAARIASGMTCAQWEAIQSAVFPESEEYNAQNWWHREDSEEIAERWNASLADAIWGNPPEAAQWLERENFMDICGNVMR